MLQSKIKQVSTASLSHRDDSVPYTLFDIFRCVY